MQRPIKFRVWNTKLKCWGGEIFINSKGVKAPTMLYEDVKNRGDNYKICQFTGLKDKKGKEIYEGDIVRYKLTDPQIQYKDGVDRTLPIRFSQFSGGWEVGGDEANSGHGLYFVSHHGPIEVIGNVYENPELIKPPKVDKK